MTRNRTIPAAGMALALALGLSFLLSSAAGATVPDRTEVQRMVVEEALRNGTVPPALALGVARVESGFRAGVESHKGARGVMQIMPATAKGEFGADPDELWDARTNIRLGVAYLERLYRLYGNRWDAALSHYNGGSLKNGRPHGYTRGYVSDVMAWARRFERDRTTLALAASGTTSASEALPAARPAVTESRPAPYWLFEEPGIERGWRDYLDTADRWLKDPQGARLPGNGEFRDVWDSGAAPAWTPVTGADAPSDRQRRSIREFRRGVLDRINRTPGPTTPVTGRPPRFG